MKIFVSCGEGLENLLQEELKEFGITDTTMGYRGIFVEKGSMEKVYKINYCSRIGARVLLPISNFNCFNKDDLYKEIFKVNWEQLIPEGKTFSIDANVHHKALRNSLFAAQVTKDAICDQLREKRGHRPNIDLKNPDVQINLFIHHMDAILSFDTSGHPLHKRGYRQDTGEAPIQESLAAALLRIAKYTGEEILFDPCFGSGTFLIEAALIATKTPPGYLRKNWGFMYHPEFSQTEWLKVKNAADANRTTLEKNKIQGCEIDFNLMSICRANLRSAGFLDSIDIRKGDFSSFIPTIQPNFLIANPPHGKRLDNPQKLIPLYRNLGEFIKTKLSKPGKGFIFTGNLDLAKEVGLAPKKRHVINNSGVDSRFLEFDVY